RKHRTSMVSSGPPREKGFGRIARGKCPYAARSPVHPGALRWCRTVLGCVSLIVGHAPTGPPTTPSFLAGTVSRAQPPGPRVRTSPLGARWSPPTGRPTPFTDVSAAPRHLAPGSRRDGVAPSRSAGPPRPRAGRGAAPRREARARGEDPGFGAALL